MKMIAEKPSTRDEEEITIEYQQSPFVFNVYEASVVTTTYGKHPVHVYSITPSCNQFVRSLIL